MPTRPQSPSHSPNTSRTTNNILNQTIYNPVTQLSLDTKFWWQAYGMFFLILLICQPMPYHFDYWLSCILPVAIMLSVKQSGAHYNPSMSFSNFFIKFSPVRFSPAFMWMYFKAEFFPAFAAFTLATWMRGYHSPPLIPNQHLTPLQIITSQAIGTFMLVVLLQKIANSQTTFTTTNFQCYNFVVVFVYVARKFAVVSGNSINPVATFAGVWALVFQCQPLYLTKFHLYFVGDFLGSCLGTLFYNYMLEPAIRKSRSQAQSQKNSPKNEDQQPILLQSPILPPHSPIFSQPSLTAQLITEIQIEQERAMLKLTRIQIQSCVESEGEYDILNQVKFSQEEMRLSYLQMQQQQHKSQQQQQQQSQTPNSKYKNKSNHHQKN